MYSIQGSPDPYSIWTGIAILGHTVLGIVAFLSRKKILKSFNLSTQISFSIIFSRSCFAGNSEKASIQNATLEKLGNILISPTQNPIAEQVRIGLNQIILVELNWLIDTYTKKAKKNPLTAEEQKNLAHAQSSLERFFPRSLLMRPSSDTSR